MYLGECLEAREGCWMASLLFLVYFQLLAVMKQAALSTYYLLLCGCKSLIPLCIYQGRQFLDYMSKHMINFVNICISF